MERKQVKPDNTLSERLQQEAEKKNGLTAALASYSHYLYSYYGNPFQTLWDTLTQVYGKDPLTLTSVDEFWNRAFADAVRSLVGNLYAEEIYEILVLRMEGQFAYGSYRRSYRSKNFGFYVSSALDLVRSLIKASCYTESVEELLYCDNDTVPGYKYRLALRIRQKDEKIISLVREAMLGENSKVLFSRAIIEAVIISKDEELVEDLLKLLLAARLQEGLRQQILESADVGSTEVMARIIKLCIEEDLFRYSSAIRAFDTWSGLGYGDAKPANVKKCAEYAYACLTDAETRNEYLKSENTQQVYFALWAVGADEIEDTARVIPQLLGDAKKYRRILGWLFVARSDSDRMKMNYAQFYLKERDEEILAWIVSCLPVTREFMYAYHREGDPWKNDPVKNTLFPDTKAKRQELFAALKEIALYIGNKSQTFTGNPFDFIGITLNSTRVIDCMISIAGYDMDEELVNQLFDLQHLMSADQRLVIITFFLRPETQSTHRKYLREALGDRSVNVKEYAVKRLSVCRLEPEDYTVLAGSLRSKSSGLRKAILSVFHKQKPAELRPVIDMMLAAEEEYQTQAAAELLLEMKEKHPEIANAYTQKIAQLRQERKLSSQTMILLDRLSAGQETEEEYTKENGFGLYSPEVTASFFAEISSGIAVPVQKGGFLSNLFGKKEPQGDLLSAKQLKAMLPGLEDVDAVLLRMNRVFERHADYEYEVKTWEGRERILFGDPEYDLRLPAEYNLRNISEAAARIEMVPFYEEFLDAMGQYAEDAEKWVSLCYVFMGSYGGWLGSSYRIAPWFVPYENLGLTENFYEAFHKKYGKRYGQMISFIYKVYQRFDAHEVFAAALRMYRSIIAILGEENLGKVYMVEKENPGYIVYGPKRENSAINHRMLCSLRNMIGRLSLSAEDFRVWFLQEYRWEKLAGGYVERCLQMEEYFRACEEGTAPKDVLMEFLIYGQDNREWNIKRLTNRSRRHLESAFFEKYPWADEVAKTLVERILQVEEKRGELPTPFTGHAQAIERFEGAIHFCNLLAALGKESFFRGYEYSSDTTKKAILSRLLKRCYPAKEDTPEQLAAFLKQTDIREKRLVEAVMYAPQWAVFAEKILGWTGLRCGVWFFHAHINETFSAEKETEVAIYSPISPVQFNDGAFDKNWFFRAYEQLGKERFELLYKSAKYITSGSNQHRRSQLYTDAVLGRLKAEELLAEITEKRNQEKLRCYPLIPIAEGDKQEALRRYEFIQKFLKESKQFGAMRRESEKKACEAAMENLAITTGYMDVNRLMWQMESAKLEEIRPYMEPAEIEGISLRLRVNENGDAEIALEKNGKTVKSAPKSFAKNEYYLTLKSLEKALKEQKRRARESLERAMITSTQFGAEEVVTILGNPVLKPMVSRLVWNDGNVNGFLCEENGTLTMKLLSGEEKVLKTAPLRVSHPHDLKASGEWAGYMRLLYEEKIIQPFKQVFREYYPITEDEKQERLVSRRYAGHQVQPKKTVALLKSRGWTVDYEEGLQKVYYKENLIVRMYAMADWFSPADIEAPTLETIRFFDRNSGEPVELDTVPPIVFSETMRDIDLVVSVAHVGGVDPEASHSTVEMRIAIAAELTALLKVQNVSWIGAHAKIQGSLAAYSVHMGSGVVHAEGKGMIAILPVHSQARGRIFLPFADEDPKTAEIMSKILLLAEDQKIKDPAILNQICS